MDPEWWQCTREAAFHGVLNWVTLRSHRFLIQLNAGRMERVTTQRFNVEGKCLFPVFNTEKYQRAVAATPEGGHGVFVLCNCVDVNGKVFVPVVTSQRTRLHVCLIWGRVRLREIKFTL